MAQFDSLTPSNTERRDPPSVFQATSSEGPVVWRPLAESFRIVKTSRAPGGGFTVYQIVFKVWTESPERGPVIQECEVWKRYSDFQHLSKQLEAIHLRSRADTAFPAIVKAKYFERFKETVIEERKKSAEALLYFSSYYQHLAESQPLRQFLSGAKIVGRVAANRDKMSDSSPSSSPFPVPSYPPLTDLDPTADLRPDSTSDLHPNSSEEEKLVAGSSLTTHTKDHLSESLTERTEFGRDSDGETTPSAGDERGGQQGVWPQPRTSNSSRPGLLAVPVAGDVSALSSGADSANESWENLDISNGVRGSSSNVSLDENVELDAEVREAAKKDLEVEVGSIHVTQWNVAHSLKLRESESLRPRLGEQGINEESENESDSQEERKQLRNEVLSDSSSSKPNSPPSGIAIVGPPRSSASNRERGGANGGGEGMDWWKDAMAESENVTDDIDSLVEQLETDGGGVKPIGSTPLSSESHASSTKATYTVSTRSVDGVINLDQRTSVAVAGEGKGREEEQGKAVYSSGRGSKTGSRHSSRSPSPRQRRGSASISEKGAYVVQAGRLIKKALSYEKRGEYQEAFDLFKAGVDVLLNGVQTDQSRQRREVVRRKTAEYLNHAEELYQKHLADDEEDKIERLEQLPPPRTAKPHLLPDFKVIKVIGKVILVESRHTGQKYIFKVLYKSLQAMAAVGKGGSKSTTNRTPSRCPHMVRLLHHYETSTHRIFLLLNYVGGGRLIDFVSSKRAQWNKLHEAVTNPHPSSSLIMTDTPQEKEKEEEERKEEMEEEEEEEGKKTVAPVMEDVGGGNQTAQVAGNDDEKENGNGEQDDSELERMLGELASIVPPKSLPITDSLTSNEREEEEKEGKGEERESNMESEEDSSEPSNSIDRLALLRKRLEESAEPEEQDPSSRDSLTRLDVSRGTDEEEEEEESSATINILPATPTVPSKSAGFNLQVMTSEDRTQSTDSLTVEDALVPRTSLASVEDMSESRRAVAESPAVDIPEGGRKVSISGKGSPGQSSPCFSPGAHRRMSDANAKADDWILRLEDKVRVWAAQIIVALDHLHSCGIVCSDLNPNNLLINDSKSAVLTYFGKWDFVEPKINHEHSKGLYIAPELCGLSEVRPSADWWSLGVILFEILTGKTLASCHPDGVHSHLSLRIPVGLSPEAQSLLSQLLQVNPSERLGAGLAGVEELKAHPFFSSVDWTSV